MCSDSKQIEKLKCQIAKLQRRVCELECSRGFIINPQPSYTPVFYSSGAIAEEIYMYNCTTNSKLDDGKYITGSELKC